MTENEFIGKLHHLLLANNIDGKQYNKVFDALLSLIEEDKVKLLESLDSKIHEYCSVDDDADIDGVLRIIKDLTNNKKADK